MNGAEVPGQSGAESVVAPESAPAEPKREKPSLSREEFGSLFYGVLFVIVAAGCFFFIGW